jgi:hypothetical protein
MKFIGKIRQQTSTIFAKGTRFLGDIFYPTVSSGDVASDKFLGLDSNNKLVTTTGGGGGGVFKRNDTTTPTTAAEFTQSGVTYDFILNNTNSVLQQRLSTLNQTENGIFSVTFTRTTELTFNITGFALQDSSGGNVSGDKEVGTGTFLSNAQGFQCNYNQKSQDLSTDSNSNRITGFGLTLPIVENDLNASEELVDFKGSGVSSLSINYPTIDFGSSQVSGTSTYQSSHTFTINAKVGSTAVISSITIRFKRKKYFGFATASSLDSAGIQSLTGSFITTKTTLPLAETSFTPSGSQFLYFCYPAQYGNGQTSATTANSFTIKDNSNSPIALNAEIGKLSVVGGLDHLTANGLVSVTVNGKSYDYEVYRSPQAYSASTEFKVSLSF